MLKKQELPQATFETMTADFIMSQPWSVGPGAAIAINYHDPMLGVDEICVVLSANKRFRYPDVSAELCERVRKEHNQTLNSNDTQMRSKTMKQTGLNFIEAVQPI